MNFFSVEFCVVFLLFLPLYWLSIEKKQLNKIILLLFSYLLIVSFSKYYLLINFIFSSLVFLFGKIIQRYKNKISLACSLIFIVGLLAYFKFHPILEEFFSYLIDENVFSYLLKGEILLPLGISFYSFMAITYLVGTYKDEVVNPTYLDTLIFLSFFATVVSGPIFRASHFFIQLNSKKEFKKPNLILSLITIAIVKKILISNHLSNILPPIFENPEIYSSNELILAPFGYSFMLYCDFSGYVDLMMAIGLMIGFSIPKNFNKPYQARDLREFWSSWHISLTTFIRDYIYIPLGGNKKGVIRTQINVFMAFIISGIWHGVGLGFVIWGALHALGIIFLNLTKNMRFFKNEFTKRVVTFTYVSICWIFFVMDFESTNGYIWHILHNDFILNGDFLKILFLISLFIFLYPKFQIKKILILFYKKFSNYEKIVIIVFFLIAVYYFMPSGMPNFIYQGF